MVRSRAAWIVGAGLTLARPAFADPPVGVGEPPPSRPVADTTAPPPRPREIREEVPAVSYTTSAFGASRYSAGALSYVGLLGGAAKPSMSAPGASITSDSGSTQITAGARIWGSPVERLTIFLGVDRR